MGVNWFYQLVLSTGFSNHMGVNWFYQLVLVNALYFDKLHGRNKTCIFEDLVAAGEIKEKKEIKTGDIDLFLSRSSFFEFIYENKRLVLNSPSSLALRLLNNRR